MEVSTMKRFFIAVAFTAIATLFLTGTAYAQLGTATGTTTLTVNVAAEAGLTVGATPNLTSVGSNFGNYAATTNLTYYVRTATSGSITLKVTTDFPCASGGPCV